MTGYLLDPFIQVQDNNGLTVPGAKVYVYNADTTVPAVTYSDFDGHANTHPVVADSLGHVSVIAEQGYLYDVVINYPDDTLLMSQKGISPCGGSGGGSVAPKEILYITLDTSFEEVDTQYKAGKELILRVNDGYTENYRLVWASNGSYSFFCMPKGLTYEGADPAAVGWIIRSVSSLGWSVSYSTDDWKLATKKYVDKYKQNTLTAGTNIEISDDTISVVGLAAVATSGSYNDLTDLPTVERGTLVKEVGGSALGPVETPVDVMRVYPSTGSVSLDGTVAGALTPPTTENAMLITNQYGGMLWQNFTRTGWSNVPVYINSSREFSQCDVINYTGTTIGWGLSDTLTLDGTNNEQVWNLEALRRWPYGFQSYEMHYSAVLTVPTDLLVRVYLHNFLYVNGEFTALPKHLAWVGFLKEGTGSIQWLIRTLGRDNNTYLYDGQVTVQPLTSAQGNILIAAQVGGYNPMPTGNTLGTLPTDSPAGPWVDPT